MNLIPIWWPFLYNLRYRLSLTKLYFEWLPRFRLWANVWEKKYHLLLLPGRLETTQTHNVTNEMLARSFSLSLCQHYTKNVQSSDIVTPHNTLLTDNGMPHIDHVFRHSAICEDPTVPDSCSTPQLGNRQLWKASSPIALRSLHWAASVGHASSQSQSNSGH